MGTPYSNIYNTFLDDISDYTFLSATPTVRNDILKGYLKKGVVRFRDCNTSLSRNDTTEEFTVTLTEEEQYILSKYMVESWLNQRIFNINLLRQRMSSKDFKLTSQAQHLESLVKLKRELRQEINKLVTDYLNSLYDLDDDLD